MSSFFHTGLEETVLLQQWKTTSAKDIALTCVAIFFLSAATEVIKSLRLYLSSKYIEKVVQREACAYEMRAASGEPQESDKTRGQGCQRAFPENTTTKRSTSYGPSCDAPKDANDISQLDPDLSNITLNLSKDATSVSRHKYSRRTRGWIHLLASLLFLLQITLSLIMMLVFMTFNVWLCLSVVLGLASGYLCFALFRIQKP